MKISRNPPFFPGQNIKTVTVVGPTNKQKPDSFQNRAAEFKQLQVSSELVPEA